MSRKRTAAGILVAAALVLSAAACGKSSSSSSATTASSAGGGTTANSSVSGTVTFDGVWTSSSGAKQFADVIAGLNKLYPKVKINYKPVGDNLPTVLSTAVAGGHPPDMADIAQPGFVQQLANQNKLTPITYAVPTIAKNFSPAWRQLGTFNGKLYALVFKAANKSVLWYNVPAFKAAGVTPPKTWQQMLTDAKTLKASGTPAYSIGGADGWTLTDLFENIYLRTWGPAKYAALSAHKIPWTDASVTTALNTMAQVLGDTGNLAGGSSGAIQAGFNDSVTNAFSDPAKAAMVFEGDFVAGVITSSTKSKPGSGFGVTAFPVVKAGSSGSNGVEIGGDLFVTFHDTPAIRAFVNYLATPQAAAIWAKQGGFSTGNHNMPSNVYPDEITRATAAPVQHASSVVFDMSDEQPSAFGATAGQGEWGLFQDFLKNPKDIAGIQKKLESAAAAAYKKSK